MADPQSNRPVILTDHLVAIVDLLGQSNALMELRQLPRTEEERAAVIEGTLGQISPAEFERRKNEEGVDPMENCEVRGFPQANTRHLFH
jgi:hypothetical protein